MKPFPFTIIIDTREQAPLLFSLPTERGTLQAGDYSIKGFETAVCIERKSEDDLLGSITHDRDRFYRELLKMRSYAAKAIVVESSYARIVAGMYRSRMDSNAAAATIASIMIRFSIPIFFAGNHELASHFALDFFRRFIAIEGEHARKVQAALDALNREALL